MTAAAGPGGRLAPPTRMDEHQLMEEGYYNIYGRAGARTEMPGCSLCRGNQARVAPNTTCVSTSPRNFPNRLDQGANVYLASAELISVAAMLGKLPTMADSVLAFSWLHQHPKSSTRKMQTPNTD